MHTNAAPDGPRALRDFFATEVAGGVLLVSAAVAALAWANSPWHASYDQLWHTAFGISLGQYSFEMDLRHWVNDGLMAVFFLVVGLEVKREFLLGELRDRRTAALPIFGAIGGMVLPALIFVAVQLVRPTAAGGEGWGIPVATDIAFALGVLALVAPRIPPAARLFLLTLAIVDDIGAIVLIAVFYGDSPKPMWVGVAVGICVLVLVLQKRGVRTTPLFVTLGLALWFALHESGVHATLAGVAMGLMAPAAPAADRRLIQSSADALLDVFSPKAVRETTRLARSAVSELEWLEHEIHTFSSGIIVPLFAFANAGIIVTSSALRDAIVSPVALGVLLGLVVGKTVGITGGAWVGTRLGVAELPDDVRWRDIAGLGALGGIGFTVSIFISNLAFSDATLNRDAKIAVVTASLLATGFGAVILRRHRGSVTTSDPSKGRDIE